MSITATILEEILGAARSQGLDQAAVARAAGVAAETISRAKRRGNIELRTLTALAEAAGVRLRVEPLPARPAPGKERTSSLAEPRWGIAWSNPNMSVRALVTNALLKGAFDVIVEAAAEHGLEVVRRQWDEVRRARPARVSATRRAAVERILANIAKGFARAEG
jgi:transcriptional regulator with XRE-family HTH domain